MAPCALESGRGDGDARTVLGAAASPSAASSAAACAAPAGPPPSRVLLLRNLVSDAEADDPSLPDEVRGECAKFGEVLAVRVFKGWGAADAPADAGAVVKIFAVFAQPAGARSGQAGLHGRWFGGRRVEAVLYDQTRFDKFDLSG